MAEGSKNGWPTPGPQAVSVQDVMTNLYFMTDSEWEKARTRGDFDYVVIGSSFCALGFTKRVLENNPTAKILIIDRGTYFHPEHFQNLPPAYSKTVGGESETFHWKITEDTHNGEYIHYQHGMNNFFGGRSSFWSAWCPKPTYEEMAGWPQDTKDKVHEYFPLAEQLLHVTPANEIHSKERPGDDQIFGRLQVAVYELLEPAATKMDEIYRVEHAPLAVNADQYR
jgi:choline dehydrogenase-like flavoprotein